MIKPIFIIILAAISISLPVGADDTLNGSATTTDLIGGSNLRINRTALTTNTIQVNLSTDKGDQSYGCLGAVIDFESGTIQRVYRESDLNRLQIARGDRIVAINGHRYDGATFSSECVGAAGSQIELTIINRAGESVNVAVARVDARKLVHNSPYFQTFVRGW